MTADYGQRAAFALNRCAGGPNADKFVAGKFGISVRMAKYLRRGLFWTTERLNQASAAFQNFDMYLAAPDQIHARLDELEQELVALRTYVSGGGDEACSAPGSNSTDQSGDGADEARAEGSA